MSSYIHTEDVHNTTAASVILPLVFNKITIKSILDVGCGLGTWLHVSKKLGVNDVLGIDSEFVNIDLLKKYIALEEYVSLDLKKPFSMNRRYDLVLCLEVAEHISEEFSDILVENLINHSDLVLFSAAIPFQGGQNHINEQWPFYWAEKFSKFGYKLYDIIRPSIWENKKIEFWYKQNIFIYSKLDLGNTGLNFISFVHPELYLKKNEEIKNLKNKIFKINSRRNILSSILNLFRK